MSEKRILHRHRVVEMFGGKHTAPRVVSEALGVDRAAACRLLQGLVTRGEAKQTRKNSDYYVYKPKAVVKR